MDADERALREHELTAQRKATGIAKFSFMVSAVAVIVSIIVSTYTLRQSNKQFKQNLQQSTAQFKQSARDTLYNNIITGLSSSAAAVQYNSMWLLEEFVQNPANYTSPGAQSDGARDAIQTLDAFIEDNSSVKGQSGLTYFESPQPIILSRAISRLNDIDSDPSLGRHSADISRGNFHGVSLPKFKPRGSFIAIGTDFRRANLAELDLRAKASLLDDSFFTCANLSGARFGGADLSGADLTGANLSGADLSHVANLDSGQLRHATVDSNTKLPLGVSVNSTDSWSSFSTNCIQLTDRMTGMLAGQGYLKMHPCPTNVPAAREQQQADPPFRGDVTDLVSACSMRNS